MQFFKKILGDYIPELRKAGMSEREIQQLETDVEIAINNQAPPKIAVVGLTGVGKSSTLNALFNAGRETNDVVACTREEAAIYGDVSTFTGSKGKIIVYDMPGLGEGIIEDKQHIETYRRVLPNVDVIVWTLSAGDRKMKPEQEALLMLKQAFGREFIDRLVIVINKADIIAPGETSWRKDLNMPCLEQINNIEKFEREVSSKIKAVLPEWNGVIVSYSAKYRYHLDKLMMAILEAVPPKRRWIFEKNADVADFKEFIDPRYMDYIMKMMKSTQGR